jgi:hypothetical protein
MNALEVGANLLYTVVSTIYMNALEVGANLLSTVVSTI